MIMSRSFIHRIGNFSEKFIEKFKTHILLSLPLFFFENRVVYKIKNTAPVYGKTRQATDHNIIWRMRFSFWINKATGRLSE
jgi:hypothetical protein